MHEVKKVKYLEDYKLLLTFEDSKVKELDVEAFVDGWEGVFEPLREISFFKQVKINNDFGSIEWPNEVDFCPDVLYEVSKEVGK